MPEEVCYPNIFDEVVLDVSKDVCPSDSSDYSLEEAQYWLFSLIESKEGICFLDGNDSFAMSFEIDVDISDNLSDDSFPVDFPSENQDEDDEYSLKDVIKTHIENVVLRNDLKDKLWYEHIPSALGVGYYGFVIYMCPMAGVSLGAFKLLKASGALDEICNEDYSILGITACDIAEEVLFSSTLFNVAGKLALSLQGTGATASQKLLLGAADKVFRKTMLSNNRMKSGRSDDFIVDGHEYVPNIAFVIASEAVELATDAVLPSFTPGSNIVKNFAVGAVRVAPYKVAGQIAKEFTKATIYDRENTQYEKPVGKAVMVTACGLFLPGYKNQALQAHVYGWCLTAGGSMSSKASKVWEAMYHAEHQQEKKIVDLE